MESKDIDDELSATGAQELLASTSAAFTRATLVRAQIDSIGIPSPSALSTAS